MTNRQVWSDDIQPVEALGFEQPENRYMRVVLFRIALVYVILMAGAFLILLTDISHEAIVLIIVECALVTAFAINACLARKIYGFKGYALRDKDVTYRSGIFFTSVTTIPFSKIQQVSIRMNPVSRIFKLYYVDVTSGAQGVTNSVSIPGLTRKKAEEIKSLLLNNVCRDND